MNGTTRIGILSFARPDRFFPVAALLFGAVFAAVTPPFQVPDEPAHFYRAYAVSEGRLDVVPRPGRTGDLLPASVHRIGTDLLGDLPFHPDHRIDPRVIRAAFQQPLEPAKREFVFFPSGWQYTFVPYLPQAVGIAAGRLFGAPPLALFYLARLTNLVFGVLAIAFAVRRLPAFAWLASLVALTPMALSLLGSCSADVTTIAAAFVLVSTVAKLAWAPDGAARRRDLGDLGELGDLGILAASSAVLCAAKPPYLPLALLVLAIPAARLPGARRAGFLLLDTALSLVAAAWVVVTSRTVGVARLNAGVDSGRQIHDALAQPLRFFRVVAADYAVNAPRYLSQLVGKLGWLDTRLPSLLVIAYLAVLGALVFLDAGPRIDVRPWQRGILAAATLAAMLLISASQYAVWTPYGADFIQGIQGRYFLPLLPAAAWALHGRRWAERLPPQGLGALLAAFSLVSLGVAVRALVGRYYGV
ncbi:MAG TPA: DUF2142 domain-containing protein [Thermoanaerobaculia bacterium]